MMNEKEIDNMLDKLSDESIEMLDKLLNDSENGEVDGLGLLGAVLSLNDNDFEILRPVFQDSISAAYRDPNIQLQAINSLQANDVDINELLENPDKIAEAFLSIDTIEKLSQSKKDFIQFIFSSMINSLAQSTVNPAHIVDIPVEICREGAKLPTYATNGSGAMDIYSPEEYNLKPGECIIIPVGIKVALPHGYALLIQPRSGLSRRIKLRIPNSPGLIDEDYHEEIGVIVENIDPPIKEAGIVTLGDGSIEDANLYGSSITIGKGERFAQMRLVEVPRVHWHEVKTIGQYDDDHGAGFGSSGTH